MKFYILYGGVLFNPDKSRITPGHGVNELIKIPVPMYVIDHPIPGTSPSAASIDSSPNWAMTPSVSNTSS